MGGAWRDDHADNIQAAHWWCNSDLKVIWTLPQAHPRVGRHGLSVEGHGSRSADRRPAELGEEGSRLNSRDLV